MKQYLGIPLESTFWVRANREDLGKEVIIELSRKDGQNSVSCGQYVETAI